MIDVEIATVILSDQSFHNSIRGYSRQGFKQTEALPRTGMKLESFSEIFVTGPSDFERYMS